jgi:hypothetical protein
MADCRICSRCVLLLSIAIRYFIYLLFIDIYN